jgi:phage baseplate assembly protein W
LPTLKKWSDLDLDFTPHPNTGQLISKKDDDAVVRSVRHLLLTNFYERPFHPEIGSNVVKQLFEPNTMQTALNMKQAIIDTINNFEPRVQIKNLHVSPSDQEHGYMVNLSFYIINEEVERVTQFFLERTR